MITLNEERIVQFIGDHPGCYLREIRRNLKISMGSAQYNLYQLENRGRVVSVKRGIHKFFFLKGIFGDYEKNLLQILNRVTSRKILMVIVEQKNPTQSDIVQHVGISHASLHRYIDQLKRFNIIKEASDGRYKRYELLGKNSTDLILALFKNYYSNIWIKWSERLTEMYLAMSQDDNN